ncbi:MAG TPA: amino acid ABC transporter substrate-binding protein [Acidimicrobiia bacterium]|nr:amino acid ABC transporter substrate-binding protein [Acidimicrobiia bacterium]
MTRRLLALLAVMAMVLAACGGDAGTDTTAAAPDTTTAAPEPTDGGTDTTDAPTDTTSDSEGEAPSGDPIVVGSTLALTGPLAPTAAIHKVAGDLFVERLNASGGLLGRPVEWRVLDDESVADQAAALYERLITEDQVDLIIGPYGTGAIAAAIQVAERYGYVYNQHTGSLTYAFTYECHFPSWPTGRYPNATNPELVYDALESTGNPPETIAFVINQFPGSMFVAYGNPDTGDPQDAVGAKQLAEERGYEVVLDVQYPLDISDWSPIAAQVRDADPDFVYLGALGVDGPNLLAALDALDYQLDGIFMQWPAPGPVLGAGESAEGVLSVTAFESHAPFTDDPEYAEVADAFREAATEAGIPYPEMETQASASWAAWETLVAGVEGAGDVDNEAACEYLRNNPVSTIFGDYQYGTESNNYYGDISYIKQVQDGDWWVVYPEENAAPDRTLEYSPGS